LMLGRALLMLGRALDGEEAANCRSRAGGNPFSKKWKLGPRLRGEGVFTLFPGYRPKKLGCRALEQAVDLFEPREAVGASLALLRRRERERQRFRDAGAHPRARIELARLGHELGRLRDRALEELRAGVQRVGDRRVVLLRQQLHGGAEQLIGL